MIKKILIVLIIILMLGFFVRLENNKKESDNFPTYSDIPSSQTELLGPGNYNFSLVHDSLTRTYKVHVSSLYNKKTPTPLVIALHGYLGQGEDMKKLTLNSFDNLADSDNFIIVYPDGIKKAWNVGQENIKDANLNIDDVGFIRVLIKDLENRFSVDSKRIYATGMSNGSYFTNKLGCELSDIITAIAPVGGGMPEAISLDCKSKRALPVIIFHGTKDPYALYNGGKSGRGIFTISEEAAAKFWAQKNSCNTTPFVKNLQNNVEDGTSVTQILYTDCKNGADVILYKIVNGGHTWPGGWQYLPKVLIGKTTQNIDASEVIWDFFKKYSL